MHNEQAAERLEDAYDMAKRGSADGRAIVSAIAALVEVLDEMNGWLDSIVNSTLK